MLEASLSVDVECSSKHKVCGHTNRIQWMAGLASVYEVIGGELIDVEAGFVPVPIDPELIYRYKTSS